MLLATRVAVAGHLSLYICPAESQVLEVSCVIHVSNIVPVVNKSQDTSKYHVTYYSNRVVGHLNICHRHFSEHVLMWPVWNKSLFGLCFAPNSLLSGALQLKCTLDMLILLFLFLSGVMQPKVHLGHIDTFFLFLSRAMQPQV